MSIINNALSGMNANKVAIDVTSQNVANVNTPGYSRQQANMTSVMANKSGFSAGNGVEITDIRRVTDQYVVRQTWLTNSQAAYSENFSSSMGELETLLGSDSFSISDGLDNFYAALNDASVKPDSSPLRQQLINESEALTNRFSTLSESLLSQHRDLNEQRNSAISQLNGLLQNIADVNGKVVEMKSSGANPTQLEDEREKLIGELSSLADVRTTQQQNGSFQVTLASGQPLVMGTDASTLVAVPKSSDPYQAQLSVDFSGQNFAITGEVGGQIGAIEKYQTDVLVPAYDALDDMAEHFANEVNDVLASGTDLQGNAGKPLFQYDAANPAASMKITDIQPDEVAFSADGTPGNNDVLQKLVDTSNTKFNIAEFGNMSIHNAFSSLISQTAIRARQASSDYTAASALNEQATMNHDSLSAVNEDEEAANLMTFSDAYQANMKVISVANELFDTMLRMF